MKQSAITAALLAITAALNALASHPAVKTVKTPLGDLNDGLTTVTAKTRKNGIDRYFAPHFSFIKKSAKHSSIRVIAETLLKRDRTVRKHYGTSARVTGALSYWMASNGIPARFAR